MRQGGELCPTGIKGGYERNQTYDDTFSIDCLDNQPTHNCCSTLMIDANKKIKDIQAARMGTYEKVFFLTKGLFIDYL